MTEDWKGAMLQYIHWYMAAVIEKYLSGWWIIVYKQDLKPVYWMMWWIRWHVYLKIRWQKHCNIKFKNDVLVLRSKRT